MLLSEMVVAAIEAGLNELLEKSGQTRPGQLRIEILHPASEQHGDYSTNVAMQLARTLKKAPLAIAEELIQVLQRREDIARLFGKVEAAPPGFINLYINWHAWAEWSDKAADKTTHKASGKVKADRGKALIEHTSINPNKSAHIGHLRNSCIGDTLARMIKRAGYEVEVHNYIDDLGNQLADTVVGMRHVEAEGAYTRFGDFCWEIYAKVNRAYKLNPELAEQRTEVLHALEEGSGNTAWLGLLTAERIVREHLEEMRQFGIGYDVLVWESSIVREGFWARAFELLRQTAVFQLETEGKLAGCWVLKQPDETGASPDNDTFHADKVLVRSNGILTYTAKDIAYHLWKFGLLGKDFQYKKFAEGIWSTVPAGVPRKIGGADTVVNVIDHRQEYPQLMVKQALQALGFDGQAERLRHVSYGVVSLSPETAAGLGVDVSDGRSSYPMSGRQGIGVKIADFLDRMEQVIDDKRSRKAGLSSRSIAAAAIRYYLLRFHLQTEVVFDLEQATEVSGNTGIYLMYSYARACSILDKAAKNGHAVQEGDGNEKWNGITQWEPQETSLLRHIAYWPETLQGAIEELAPNTLCTYAHELTTLFNHFYATCPILKAEGSRLAFRLWLTARYMETLQEALQLLGLPAPKRM